VAEAGELVDQVGADADVDRVRRGRGERVVDDRSRGRVASPTLPATLTVRIAAGRVAVPVLGEHFVPDRLAVEAVREDQVIRLFRILAGTLDRNGEVLLRR